MKLIDRAAFGACAIFAFIASAMLPANATVIYSNFSSSPFTGGGYVVDNIENPASAFTSNGNYSVSQIDVSAQLLVGFGNKFGSDPATVSLWTNSSGIPGVRLNSWTVSLSRFSTITSIPVSGLNLQQGHSYYLQMGETANTVAGWRDNNEGVQAPVYDLGFSHGENQIAPAFDVLGQRTPSFGEAIDGAVRLAPFGQNMIASFTPNFSLSLGQAAQLGGFDHFNWLQYAEVYPGRVAPFQDPPNGGLAPQKADDLPFYWDENPVPGGDGKLSLAANIIGNTLQFTDTPEDSFVTPGFNSMEFQTFLVGVRADGSCKALDVFRWESDSSPIQSGGDVILLRNIDPLVGARGGILNAELLPGPNDAAPDILALLPPGSISAVPEPSEWFILVSGFFMLGAALRLRRDRTPLSDLGVHCSTASDGRERLG